VSSEGKGHPLFGDGNIPKNKDMNGFTKSIQDKTAGEEYLKQRRGSQNVPSELSFGQHTGEQHDLVAILRNSYSHDINRVTLSSLKSTIHKKKLKPSKPTTSSKLREQRNNELYAPFLRSSSIPRPRRKVRHSFSVEGSSVNA